MRRAMLVLAMAALMAGCGDDAPSAPESQAAPQIRTVDPDGDTGACDAGESLLNAYCYVKPGGSVSASGVVFQEGDGGVLKAACLTGGRNIRLFCLKE